MEPNSFFGSAKIFAFPSGGRGGENTRREEAALKEQGVLTAPSGSGWYHESAMQAEEAPVYSSHCTPWWAEAEHESQAKGFASRAY
ncbi:MAG: DUF2735 domain-containing protein [Methylovirgula sp.]